MDDDRWQRVLCLKVNMEFKAFKKEMLSSTPEEVYKNAYRIDSCISIKEMIIEKCEILDSDILYELIMIPNLLSFLYDRWLDYEDSIMEDMDSFFKMETDKLEKKNAA